MCFAFMGVILVVALVLQLAVLRPKYDDKDQELNLEAETIAE